MEAALAPYGVDLVDLYRPGTSVTFRKVMVLVRHLPPGNPVDRVLNPHQWPAGSAEQLLDELRRLKIGELTTKPGRKLNDPGPHGLSPVLAVEAERRRLKALAMAPAIEAAKRRRDARAAAIAAGELT